MTTHSIRLIARSTLFPMHTAEKSFVIEAFSRLEACEEAIKSFHHGFHAMKVIAVVLPLKTHNFVKGGL